MDMLASFAMFAVCADIGRLIQPWTTFRYVSITDFKTYMIRTVLTPVKVASVYGSIFADAVSKALELIYTVILAFGSKSIGKSTMITYLS